MRLKLIRRNDVFDDQLAQSDKVTFHQVSKTFTRYFDDGRVGSQVTVLAEVDFSLPVGTIAGLVGRTGVGKTTLGKILGGLLRPDLGTVRIGDIDLFRISPQQTTLTRRFLRYVPQNPDAVLSPHIKVGQALQEARRASRMSFQQTHDWAIEFDRSGLLDPAWLGRPVEHLSLGQRRRVINLRSLQSGPRFLILDEPFNGLDYSTRREMLSLLCRVSRNEPAGILIISHDVRTLEWGCDRIWCLECGTLSEYHS